MAVTFNFELNNKPSKNKTYAILLRITQNQKHKRIKTPIAAVRNQISIRMLSRGNWIRQREPNYAVWNETLAQELEKARKTYQELKEDGLATTEKIAIE